MLKFSAPARGFSLIELMIAIGIVGVLAAIAVPSYSKFIRKGTVKTAESDLVSLNLNIENHYRRKLSYPDPTNLGTTVLLSGTFKGWTPASKPDVFGFKYEKTTNTATPPVTSVILTATGVGTMAGCVVTLSHPVDKPGGAPEASEGCK